MHVNGSSLKPFIFKCTADYEQLMHFLYVNALMKISLDDTSLIIWLEASQMRSLLSHLYCFS